MASIGLEISSVELREPTVALLIAAFVVVEDGNAPELIHRGIITKSWLIAAAVFTVILEVSCFKRPGS